MWPGRHNYEVIRLEAQKKASQWNEEARTSFDQAEDGKTASYNNCPLLFNLLSWASFPNQISSVTQIVLERLYS